MSDNITYTDFESPLGPMIGGTTEHGLCFLEWHDRGGVDRILTRVEKRYKRQCRPGSHQILTSLNNDLQAYFRGELKEFAGPVDVNGTPFELSVWEELLKISYGSTRSYGEMATRLGKPGGSRAVGRANGANYLAIVIPCHRVIAADGAIAGYGGKVWRKRKLLDLEAGRVHTLFDRPVAENGSVSVTK